MKEKDVWKGQCGDRWSYLKFEKIGQVTIIFIFQIKGACVIRRPLCSKNPLSNPALPIGIWSTSYKLKANRVRRQNSTKLPNSTPQLEVYTSTK
jgi:hypothetical protein